MKVIDAKPKSNEPATLIAAVIVSHGHLASEFLAAAEMILGPISHITAASIDWHDDVDVARHELERAIARVNRGHGVLLMTDMFGGAPTDIASMFLDDSGVEVISGVNLPMVLKVAEQEPGLSLAEVARTVRDSGKEGIYLAGELLPRPDKSE
jgi:PTS system mannose-specific IIA component